MIKTPQTDVIRLSNYYQYIQTGKIQSGEAGLTSLRKQLEKELGMEVDLSVIKAGGKFDNGSQLHIR